MNSAAITDVLLICEETGPDLLGPTEGELTLFGYLACLLFLFQGYPLNDWGYTFIKAAGSRLPSSPTLAAATQGLLRTGALNKSQGRLGLTAYGVGFRSKLDRLETTRRRRQYVSGAASALASFPVGLVRAVIGSEPTLLSATLRDGATPLLTGAARLMLFEEFSALRSVVGAQPALSVPANIYLAYLADQNRGREDAQPQ